MSAPLRISSSDALSLARFLSQLTGATKDTGMRVGSYGPFDVTLPGESGSSLSVTWSTADEAYIVDDRVGN